MSTSIAANIGPRASAPETQLAPPPPQHHEAEASKKQSASPTENIAFTSPVIKVDSDTGLALLVVRDGSTGEELDQYPSKKVVEEYQRVQGGTPDSSAPVAPTDSGASLAGNAVAPPAPVAPVAAPPVSAATGDARTSPAPGSGGVKPVGL
jgi:hypothetical protein